MILREANEEMQPKEGPREASYVELFRQPRPHGSAERGLHDKSVQDGRRKRISSLPGRGNFLLLVKVHSSSPSLVLIDSWMDHRKCIPERERKYAASFMNAKPNEAGAS